MPTANDTYVAASGIATTENVMIRKCRCSATMMWRRSRSRRSDDDNDYNNTTSPKVTYPLPRTMYRRLHALIVLRRQSSRLGDGEFELYRHDNTECFNFILCRCNSLIIYPIINISPNAIFNYHFLFPPLAHFSTLPYDTQTTKPQVRSKTDNYQKNLSSTSQYPRGLISMVILIVDISVK